MKLDTVNEIIKEMKDLRKRYATKQSYDVLKEYWDLSKRLQRIDPGNPECNKGIFGGKIFSWIGD